MARPRKNPLLACICPNCMSKKQYRAGYLACPICEHETDLLVTSASTTCSCLSPQIRFVSGRYVCIVCGGKIIRQVAKKSTRKQLAAYIEF